MTRVAATVARLSTRWWWVVLAGWLAVAGVLLLVAPPFQSVATFDASSFLSQQAGPVEGGRLLAEGWPDDAFTNNAAIVIAREDGKLTDADTDYARSLVAWLRSEQSPEPFGDVTAHLDEPRLASTLASEDGQALFLLVGLTESPYSPPATEAVEATRQHIAQDQAPEGLEVLVGGTAGVAADESAAIDTSVGRTHVITLALVVLILLWVYRSPVAPLVPLATIGVGFAVSISLVSLLAQAGMQVFSLYEHFAIVIVFGAGTDYCLFLISRYHEELRLDVAMGLPDTAPVRRGTLTTTVLVLVVVLGSSAATTIAGFGAMSAASFGMYRSMGPAMALSVAVTLLAAVTLAPALMRMFGSTLFWPNAGTAGGDHGAGDEPLVLRRGDEVGVDVTDVGELQTGLVEARDGTGRLRSDVAVPAEQAVRDAWETLTQQFTVGRADPAYTQALEEVGQVHGRITGEDPRTGQQVDLSYDGLPEALAELATGLGEAVDGTRQLADGLQQLDGGLAELDAGLGRLEDGLVRLRGGLAEATPGVAQLQDGIDRLRDGAQQLVAGSEELATRLAEGAAQVREVDLASLIPALGGEGAGPFLVTAGLLDALPDVREQLDLFLADDDTRTRVFVGLATDPFANEAVASIDEIRHLAEVSLNESPLQDATVRATGITAFFDAVDEAADADLPLLVGAVVLGVFLVLVLLLRALVAPIYMVVTVLLSFGAALGLTAILFMGILGQEALVWWLPPFVFVLLVALGADYNIYLMSRVREEAETKPTRRAVADATRSTGGVITSAGLILAGTFAALMAAEVTSLVQMGFATTVGILLDTFVVRSLLVPSLATLLGRHNWWPSSRAQRA